MLAVKYIETLREMTTGADNKTVYIPYEASGILSSLGSIKTLFTPDGPAVVSVTFLAWRMG